MNRTGDSDGRLYREMREDLTAGQTRAMTDCGVMSQARAQFCRKVY